MSRTFFVGGNWKCNGTTKFATDLITEFNQATFPDKQVDVVIAPPFLYLETAKNLVRKEIVVSAQDCYYQKGAFTGQVTAEMLKDINIKWVILGHSERRSIFKDTDEIVGKKVANALATGLNVIACIGESLEQREAGQTNDLVKVQLTAIAANVKDWSNVVIAYEPVWAIGTGKTASPAQAQEVHAFIRGWLSTNVSEDVSRATRIIYGGSVSPNNADDLAKEVDIDGFLVGGCSLKGPDFVKIIAAANQKSNL
eukprot:TRINITY_DN9160_c0_g1_i1.p1 TRINITY_DN9160_c0_g1~~TRINITY_DN9160_c0_g1_i1.p1  ORF type:complete len:254 (+),score=66.42 TRINITY_DN9160_c0_g1_i1:68-829(+)